MRRSASRSAIAAMSNRAWQSLRGVMRCDGHRAEGAWVSRAESTPINPAEGASINPAPSKSHSASAHRLATPLGIILGLLLVTVSAATLVARPSAEERTISFFHIHTNETLTIVYKRNGEYIPEAMKKIDWIMRDWRKNQAITMDPKTIDLLWEMYTELGSREPMHIICGYRSSGTNEMLRRTVGGQASQSQHITGKAIDITFPDIPIKQLRYSALVRERGGVGYYPTSGIPFVHVDTSRVRAWPRLPRYELALLFPDGKTQHAPATGGPITKDDVRIAREKYGELATQVAAYFDLRSKPKSPVAIASATPSPSQKQNPVLAALTPPQPASRPAKSGKEGEPLAPSRPAGPQMNWQASARGQAKVATLTPPKLVSAPRPVERSSRLSAAPSPADRSKLDQLVTLAANETLPQLIRGPAPAARPANTARATTAKHDNVSSYDRQIAALDPAAQTGLPGTGKTLTDANPDDFANGWAQAPAFDEDHPEEMAYRPFPLAPMLTETSSINDPALLKMQHPDVAKTLELLDDDGAVQPMRLRPGEQVASSLWAQQFQGKAVDLTTLDEAAPDDTPTGMQNRSVKTLSR